jgi:hypothetical protein
VVHPKEARPQTAQGLRVGGDLPSSNLKEGRIAQVGAFHFQDGRFVNYVLTLVRLDCVNGAGSYDSGCWRVEDFVLWAGEADGPRPW